MLDEQVITTIRHLQASMTEEAKSFFSNSDVDDLRCVIRLTVEFNEYLQHGNTSIAKGMLNTPVSHLFKEKLEAASVDPFNDYDLEFACDSIRSGLDSFVNLTYAYRVLAETVDSRLEWSMISSKESFKSQFTSMFHEFVKETYFTKKCCLLLDLFKMQIVFLGMSYPVTLWPG